VHLFASGSTMATYKTRYARDWQWLTQQAAARRMLALSGDLHRNETDAFFTAGFPLHEATSSGAAVKDAVILGKTRRNFGIVEVNDDRVGFTLYAHGKEDRRLTRQLLRSNWLPV
jgi:alkaline phosphatase D